MGSLIGTSESVLKVANAALIELGIAPLDSLSGNTITHRTIDAVYGDEVEGQIESYPWRFARERVTLRRADGEVPEPWGAAYLVPMNALSIITLWENGFNVRFERMGQELFTEGQGSTAVAQAEITVAAHPDKWSATFRKAMIISLAARLAMPLTQDEALALFLEQKAARAMLKAKTRDAQGRSPTRLDTGLFRRRRLAGGT